MQTQRRCLGANYLSAGRVVGVIVVACLTLSVIPSLVRGDTLAKGQDLTKDRSALEGGASVQSIKNPSYVKAGGLRMELDVRTTDLQEILTDDHFFQRLGALSQKSMLGTPTDDHSVVVAFERLELQIKPHISTLGVELP